ncbi:MAG TPA: PAS domain-containing protein [bacterium]|nr:PAS domain-containing protein [bacterium]
MDYVKNFKKRILILSVIFIILEIIGFFIVQKIVNDNFNKELKSTTQIALAAINPDRIQSMSLNPQDDSSIDYKRVKEQLLELSVPFKDRYIDCIYAMSKVDNDIVFLVDSFKINNKRYSAPGDKYFEPPEEIYKIFNDKKSYLVGPFTDEYGTFISYFTPINLLSDDTMVGVLGVDVDYNVYRKIVLKNQVLFFIILFLLYIIFVIIYLYFVRKKQIQEQILENEKKIQTVIDSIPDSIVMIDKNKKIVFYNKASEILFKFGNKNIINRNLYDLVKIPRQVIFDEKNLVTNQIHDFKINNKIIEISISSVKFNNSTFFINVFRDISQRVKDEEDLKRQTEELQKINSLMIGRELKMLELKKQLKNISK